MRTVSTLIIGAAALLHFGGLVSVESLTCEESGFVCEADTSPQDSPAACSGNPCTNNECCEADETCGAPSVSFSCTATTQVALDTSTECVGACDATQCCEDVQTCADYTGGCLEAGQGPAADDTDCGGLCEESDCCVDHAICAFTQAECTANTSDNTFLIDPVPTCDGACELDECCEAAGVCGDHVCTGGTTAMESMITTACAENVCVAADNCCQAGVITTCADYTVCERAGFVSDLSDTPCAGGFGGLVADQCDDGLCCALTCSAASYDCGAGALANGGANNCPWDSDSCDDASCCETCLSAGIVCVTGNALDEVVCPSGVCTTDDCCTTPVTCSSEEYVCTKSATSRVGANECAGGAGTCTDAECCVDDVETTITEARQKKTPVSRQHLTQYGTGGGGA